VEIKADPKMPWTLDGEYQEGCEDIVVENVQSAIKIMVKK
jgi:diacylglycerol kinase family enzyme